MPDQAWMAGPEPMRHDPDSEYCANNCGVGGLDRHNSHRCAGVDTCSANLCEGCRVQCDLCGDVACNEHLSEFGEWLACSKCIKSMVEEGLAMSAECEKKSWVK